MSRIETIFNVLAEQSKTALVTFITAGDPEPNATLPLLHVLVEAGADIIELGVPFSDPAAEGPIIQAACERALKHRINLLQIFDIVRQFREKDQKTPIILMGYLNPVEVLGYSKFAELASSAGVDGVLIVDLPPEEAEVFCSDMDARNIDPVFLVAPTSTDQRIEAICKKSRGFVYYVSIKGVTGTNEIDVASVKERVAQIKQYSTIPVGVGFGINDAHSAAEVAKIADAVVVGSAIVKLVGNNANDSVMMHQQINTLVTSLRSGIDNK